MKNNITALIFILTLFLCAKGFSQSKKKYFEGEIFFETKVEIQKRGLDTTKLYDLFGRHSMLIFKEGNYKIKSDGNLISEQMYTKATNKFYFVKRNNDNVYWSDCATKGDSILKIVSNPKKVKILGIVCDELIFYYADRIVSDYYNQDLFAINPKWFKNFTRDNENIVDEKEKAVCLKHKIEYNGFTYIQTAVGFNRKNISNDIFALPTNSILIEEK
jgi:hypothetical protein